MWNRLFVLSAPAGTGKTTLVEKLKRELPELVTSISYTTRQPRPGEVDGVHYFFVTKKQFEERVRAGDFLEYVQLYGHYYGTLKRWVEEHLAQNRPVLLTIDTQGALLLKKKSGLKAVYIFISPPSLDILKERLMKRGTESPKVIAERLEWAKKEMEAIPLYDYNIVNDDLEIAYQGLKKIIRGS